MKVSSAMLRSSKHARGVPFNYFEFLRSSKQLKSRSHRMHVAKAFVNAPMQP